MPERLSQPQKHDSSPKGEFFWCDAVKSLNINGTNVLFQDAQQLNIDKDLSEHVGAQKDKKIPYAIVRGTVQPIGTPLQSIMSPSVTGVLQVITVK